MSKESDTAHVDNEPNDGLSSKAKVSAAAAGVAAVAGGALAAKSASKKRKSKLSKPALAVAAVGSKARDIRKHLPGN